MDITARGELVIPSISPYLGFTEKARTVFDFFTDRGRYVFAPYPITRHRGIPRSKVRITTTSGSIYIIEDEILSIDIDSRRGTIKKWRVDMSNENGSYTNLFNVGDKVEIYLGYGEFLSKICSGLVYSVDQILTTIVLEGYDWSDYLTGPDVVKEYYDRDWGYILRDLITSYTVLDASNIPDTGIKSGGVVSYVHVSLWDVIQDILNIINYDLLVTPDKKVYIIKRTGNANWTISNIETDNINIGKTTKKIVNRIILYGGVEKFRDSFLQTMINEEIWDKNYFTDWSIENNNLVYSGSNDGFIHTTMGNYNYKLTVSVKQDSLPYDTSIYIRRTNLDSFVNGYRLRLESDGSSGTLKLYSASNPTTPLSTYNLTSDEIPNTTDFYEFGLEGTTTHVRGYIKGIKRIEVEESEFRSGKASLQAKGGVTTRYSYVDMISDTPIYATAEDTSLQSLYGVKELLIRKPEITLRSEAKRVANWELLYRKIVASTGKITIDGYEDIREGHILRLYLPEIGIYDEDYEVIGTKHKFREYWTTELELAEVVPRLEDVLRYLRRSIVKPEKKLAISRITGLEDTLTLFTDETPTTLIEEASIGNCRIESMEVR